MSHYGLSAYQLAKNLGYEGPQKLYKLVQNKSKPGYETLMDILDHYPQMQLGVADARRGADVARRTDRQTRSSEGSVPAYTGMPQVVTVDENGEEHTSFVPGKVEAGYLQARDVEDTLADGKPSASRAAGARLSGRLRCPATACSPR